MPRKSSSTEATRRDPTPTYTPGLDLEPDEARSEAVRKVIELRAALAPPSDPAPVKGNFEGLSLSEVADELAELNSGHGYPAYEEDDD